MKHAQIPVAEQELAVRRVPIVEQQLEDVSRRYLRLHARTRQLEAEALARAAIIRRRNAAISHLLLTLHRLLLAYGALARAHETDRPVLDTGTPGVEVTRP